MAAGFRLHEGDLLANQTQTVEIANVGLLPPYRVVLHNDDHNTMDHVVRSLTRAVPALSIDEAVAVMEEAHQTGSAIVIVCPLEPAEFYRDRLRSAGLTATIDLS